MQTSCGFGHIYDSDQYASCPYCNRGTRAIYFGAGGADHTAMPGAGNADRTVMPGVNNSIDRTVMPDYSAEQKTVAPGMQSGARNDEIGKTEIPDYMKQKIEADNKNKTVGVFKKKYGMDLIVGWLVCIEGPEKGQDYRLINGINTIGRAEGNDVVLRSEQTVSQKNHARLAYDEKHNNFQMLPGDGHNIAYVNDNPLYVPQRLNAYDVIEFGDTKLLFVPLCTEQFQWKQESKV